MLQVICEIVLSGVLVVALIEFSLCHRDRIFRMAFVDIFLVEKLEGHSDLT